jgi:hypothetical protein
MGLAWIAAKVASHYPTLEAESNLLNLIPIWVTHVIIRRGIDPNQPKRRNA